MTEAIHRLASTESPALEEYRNSLKDVEKRLSNIMEAIETGLSNEMTRSRMAELLENKRQLEASIAEENIKRKDYSDEKIEYYFDRLLRLDFQGLDDRKCLIHMMVQRVEAYPDGDLVVTLNWSGKKVGAKVDMGGHGPVGNGENSQGNGQTSGSTLETIAPPYENNMSDTNLELLRVCRLFLYFPINTHFLKLRRVETYRKEILSFFRAKFTRRRNFYTA